MAKSLVIEPEDGWGAGYDQDGELWLTIKGIPTVRLNQLFNSILTRAGGSIDLVATLDAWARKVEERMERMATEEMRAAMSGEVVAYVQAIRLLIGEDTVHPPLFTGTDEALAQHERRRERLERSSG